jgi:hypothetical protein
MFGWIRMADYSMNIIINPKILDFCMEKDLYYRIERMTEEIQNQGAI